MLQYFFEVENIFLTIVAIILFLILKPGRNENDQLESTNNNLTRNGSSQKETPHNEPVAQYVQQSSSFEPFETVNQNLQQKSRSQQTPTNARIPEPVSRQNRKVERLPLKRNKRLPVYPPDQELLNSRSLENSRSQQMPTNARIPEPVSRNNSIVKRIPLKRKIVLPIYPPDQELLSFNTPLTVETANRFVDKNLKSCGSYHDFFALALQLEDAVEMRKYLPLVQQNEKLRKHNKLYYSVQMTKRTMLILKDKLTPHCDEVVILPSQSPPYGLNYLQNFVKPEIDGSHNNVGIITHVTKESMEFCLKKESKILKNKVKVDLVMRPRRASVRYQRRALGELRKNNHMQRYLFPTDPIVPVENERYQLNLINQNIKSCREQYMAVSSIVGGAGQTAPYIVFGPPGTGKTSTIVESIFQLWQLKRRILVTASAHSACDTIAERLCEYFETINLKGGNEMIRIYSKGIIKKRGTAHIPKSLRMRSNLEWHEGDIAYPAVEDVNNYAIVVATLCTVGKYELAQFAKEKPFSHVFIDEAGFCSEPEALIAIMALNTSTSNICKVILSGDHKQLGPVIKSYQPHGLNLKKSLMERLLETKCYAVNTFGEYNRTLQSRLVCNYRSAGKIVKLYGSLYYNDDLIAKGEKRWNRKWSFLPNQSFPIAFQCVVGNCIKGPSGSWYNELEIEVLMAYLNLFLNCYHIKQKDIGIITPYRLQREYLEMCLKAQDWHDVEVGVVENFQGREKLIIITSMVRSNHGLGFLKCERRWNVMLSRPKSLLLILGDPGTLKQSRDMRSVIDECSKAGNFFHNNKLRRNEFSEIEILNERNKPYIKSRTHFLQESSENTETIPTECIAMDCEMVGIGPLGRDDMLARVSIVDRAGQTLLDKLVKPRSEITDYRTNFSGKHPGDLNNGEEFSVVQNEVKDILKDRILIGHDIEKNLKVLHLEHPYYYRRDTSKYELLARRVGIRGTPSLKTLASVILHRDIRQDEYSSIQNATAAMQIYIRFENVWEENNRRNNFDMH